MTTLEEILRRFVLQHHSGISLHEPIFFSCFDENAQQVPFADVINASPKIVAPGGIESVEPTPGVGYYAHMRRVTTDSHISRGTSNTWEVAGPDWYGVVQVLEPLPPLPMTASVLDTKRLERGTSFLNQSLNGE